jgi:hypothetical protein
LRRRPEAGDAFILEILNGCLEILADERSQLALGNGIEIRPTIFC